MTGREGGAPESRALLERLLSSGADEAGILDRFGDDTELYEMCFREFLESPEYPRLRQAVERGAYGEAFEAAHALKGLSGNLGVTACYTALSDLTEALRGGRYGQAEPLLTQTERAWEQLRHTAAGDASGEATGDLPENASGNATGNATGEASENATGAAVGEAAGATVGKATANRVPLRGAVRAVGRAFRRARQAVSRDVFPYLSMAAVVLALCVAVLVFWGIRASFREKSVAESGRQLLETGTQLRLYLEERFSNDWRIAESVGDSLTAIRWEDDEALLALLRRREATWGVSAVMFYTEDGSCVYADGSVEANGIASRTLARAYAQGSCLTVLESRLTFTHPVETEARYAGSRIAAVGVEHDLETFLREMRLSSYENEAWIYLTEERGVVISRLTPEWDGAFNVRTRFPAETLTPITENADPAALFTSDEPAAFFQTDGAAERYVVSVPVRVGGGETVTLRLLYAVPEAVVNGTERAFSLRMTFFSVLLVVLLVGLAVTAVLSLYRNRKRQFDAAISAREQMFDLLISSTRTVFGLFDLSRSTPAYLSGNAGAVLGEEYWVLERGEEGYRLRAASGADAPLLRQVNGQLQEWDGRSVFRSGYLRDDGATPPVCLECALYPAGTRGVEYVAIVQDMTDAYRREEVTRSAMELAKRSNEAKTRFLANISHDLRTPLNAILNLSVFAMENTGNSRKQTEYLSTIYESAQHLLHLVNDILDMSRIESGLTVLASEPFCLRDVLQKQANAVDALCASRRQTFLVSLEEIHTETVRGDARLLSLILQNLLANASKFTPEGGAVRFTALELPSLRDSLVGVRCTVEDNGMGIRAEELEMIFEPFYRAGGQQVRGIEGTGLGLSICKRYVDAMGGRITCQSEEGEGSTFTVELYFQRELGRAPEDAVDTAAGEKPFRGLRCLVVEDNATNRTIARVLLERLGFSVDTAADGEEGVRRFAQSARNAYDVIYLDIQLPGIDGYQAARSIRGCAHPRAAAVPILAMSANMFPEDMEKARLAGMDGYVGKPVFARELIDQTSRAMELRKG